MEKGLSVAAALRALPAALNVRLGCLAALACCVGASADYAARQDVAEYMDALAERHAFPRDWLSSILVQARKSDAVLAAISKPAEKALAWHEYRAIFLTDERIQEGVEFWRRHRAAIDAARSEFGVAGEQIVAILGVETSYGRVTGSHRVLDALATLAFDYPPRAKFFRGELTAFLRLVREEGIDPFALKGSYAGAMGYGQFIPSSYRSYAVDFDDDGRRDIWSNATDAIGSIANDFAEHGWQGRLPAAIQVELRDPAAGQLVNAGLALAHTAGELRAREVAGIDHVGDAEKAALYRMETADGAQFWVGLHDFYVITRYNRSRMYALAVYQLGEEIRSRFETAGSG